MASSAWACSARRRGARPDLTSDVDVLVEFMPAILPGFGFFRLERDLAALFGRPVDLVTPDGLHDMIQKRVLGEAVFA